MKVVVITGGARGFGLEMAKEFRKNDYNVVIMDVNKDALYDAEIELAKIKSKSRVLSLVCDITNEKEVENAIDTIDKYAKRIDDTKTNTIPNIGFIVLTINIQVPIK